MLHVEGTEVKNRKVAKMKHRRNFGKETSVWNLKENGRSS